eukprot:TRINITY_DN3297_c0_g2_i1.p1 TRINITY_DN3297_c0_g2~~TRINITY_DN3297_c0_g2_i1.p1  ORF type:complete len:125 (+),score=11.10 TRINITY_DN3297_c0_g2_i1:392-766(+)
MLSRPAMPRPEPSALNRCLWAPVYWLESVNLSKMDGPAFFSFGGAAGADGFAATGAGAAAGVAFGAARGSTGAWAGLTSVMPLPVPSALNLAAYAPVYCEVSVSLFRIPSFSALVPTAMGPWVA